MDEVENLAVTETEAPQVTGDSIDTSADTQPSSAPKTTKELIRDAFKAQRDKEKEARAPQRQTKAPAQETESKPSPQTPGERARNEKGQFTAAQQAAEAQAKAATATSPVPETTQDAQPAPAATTASGPPPGLSKEVKAIWDTIPPALQQEFIRREGDTQKGIEKLKQQFQQVTEPYRQIEQVIAPHRARYQQHGVRSDAEALHRLLSWEGWIRSNPPQALAALAAQYGVHPSTLAQPTAEAPPQGYQPQTDGQNGQLQQLFQTLLSQQDELRQQVGSVTSEYERERNDRVAKEITAFAADKAHFDRVKQQMGFLMHQAAELAKQGIGEPLTLQQAYDKATWMDDNIRNEILAEREDKAEKVRQAKAQEEETKRKADRERRAQAAKAAALSPRGSSPSAANGTGRKPHSHSVRDSILAAKADHDGRA